MIPIDKIKECTKYGLDGLYTNGVKPDTIERGFYAGVVFAERWYLRNTPFIPQGNAANYPLMPSEMFKPQL
jgi:hypothetical protein